MANIHTYTHRGRTCKSVHKFFLREIYSQTIKKKKRILVPACRRWSRMLGSASLLLRALWYTGKDDGTVLKIIVNYYIISPSFSSLQLLRYSTPSAPQIDPFFKRTSKSKCVWKAIIPSTHFHPKWYHFKLLFNYYCVYVMCIGHPHAMVCKQRSGSNSLSRALFSHLYVASRDQVHFQSCAAGVFTYWAICPTQIRHHGKQTLLENRPY